VTAIFAIPHFLSPVEPTTLKVYPNVLQGLSGATGNIEGMFDTDPTNYTDGPTTLIQDGVALLVDLIFSKTFTWGFFLVPIIISNFKPGIAVENQPAKFTCAFTVNGIPGVSNGTGNYVA
jgi:hypothetical protein